MEIAEKRLKELYDIHDHYFALDKKEKQEKLQEAAARVLEALEKADEDAVTKEDRARALYVRGKALDAFEDYSSTAERLLQTSVKLDPGNSDAWNSLGNCFWKKGDLQAARNCFTTCLDFIPGRADKQTLRNLSMLLRQLGSSVEQRSKNITASVDIAKKAVTLDINDSLSWYVLGNSYLAFFFNNSHSPSDLDRSLAAYSRAEQAGGANNPDLHYNRANVYRYKEEYTQAVKCYEAASKLDPSLPAQEAIDVLVRWVMRVHNLIERKGRVKPKKLASLIASLPPTTEVQGRKRAAISTLRQGENKGRFVALKSLVDVGRNNQPPGCFIMTDEEAACVAVSIYHLDDSLYNKLSDKDVFFVLDPYFRHIDFKFQNQEACYKCLQVSEPHLFLVNGKVCAESYAHAELKLDNFDH